ncbi:hypothetical protein MCOR25_001646 [Pyricularia grisea]|uniref:Uncharacterized protein n=1 Tax=Pyricularia grisea TaxID=148305 RepID=A0A6P8B7D6_PYRGI|nr:hypothetical protein PgNI_05724 [Pyricularia grisea]KAI6380455.1 hypothetical protein MCOR25_001646 [Pyricularia grisea]TLD11185.1 hypothetical protein PgNI_05724 [Pyricularia grisea]
MQYSTLISSFLISLGAAAPQYVLGGRDEQPGGTIQFQIDEYTATSNTLINIPGKKTLDRPVTVIGCGIVAIKAIDDQDAISCKAIDANGQEVGQFGAGIPQMMDDGKKVTIHEIQCTMTDGSASPRRDGSASPKGRLRLLRLSR